MATIAIVLGGAVLNATAFIGGNYLSRYLSGNDTSKAEEEKERLDRTIEKYQADYTRYQENRQNLLDFIANNNRLKETAKDNFANTDCALKRTVMNECSPLNYTFPTTIGQVGSKKNSCIHFRGRRSL